MSMKKSRIELELRSHHKDAFMWAKQCCNFNEDDAKEVLQMTYLKIAEGRAKFNEKSAFKTWLFSVIRFTAIDFLRGKFSYEELGEKEFALPGHLNGSDIDFQTLLKKISERQQQVILLNFYHGLSLNEIAEVMDLHVGTVRTHYERAKESLRNLVEKQSV